MVPPEDISPETGLAENREREPPRDDDAFNAVVDAVRQPFLILYPDLRIANASPSFYKTFGLSTEDIKDLPLFKLGSGAWDIPKLREILEVVLPKEAAFDDVELVHEFPDIGRKVMRISGRQILPNEGPTPKIILSIEDITERKRVQRELGDSELRFRRLFESAMDGILLVNFDTLQIEDANPYLAELLGYSRRELVGKELWEIGLFENIQASRSTFHKLSETGYIRFEDLPLQTKSGRKIEVEFVCSVYPAGSRTMIQCNVRDVTDRKRAEATYSMSEQRLRQAQKLEAIGKLAAGIAHDFNNLLTAINGYSELSLTMPEVTGILRENLAEIRKAGDRAAYLTRQILAFGRRQMLAPKVLDLNTLVEGMDRLLNRVVGEHILLEVVLDPVSGMVRADPSQLEQAILNLAINAREAMPSGGTLRLETRKVQISEGFPAHQTAVGPGPYAVLTVSDTGVGMDAEMKARIFDPFFTTKDVSKGAGLGLSVVLGIIDQSGGHVQVESEPGRGSVFTIYLPLVKPETPDSGVPAEEPAGRAAETVLLVEDEDSVRKYARRVLESRGYNVLEAPSGKSALSLAEAFKGPIHLLITDIIMPGMNGMALAERFILDHPDSRVLFLSGYAEEAIFPHGPLENKADFIQKPFSADALLECARKLLHAPTNAG